MSVTRRALHFVLKIGSLKKNVEFFRDKLGMTVLRHEVFDEGCEAACNGPYDNKWSKTMIGYGPEDNHFVLELTYNYSIGSYKLGNDFQYIKIKLSKEQYERLATEKDPEKQDEDNKSLSLTSPDGYKFLIVKEEGNEVETQDVIEVCLSSSNLQNSIKYWVDLLKMNRYDNKGVEKEILLGYSEHQSHLRLREIEEELDHKSAYGRIAFSCPADELKPLQKSAEDSGQKVLTPYISLDTPGKATVQVVILADPDGHEICFVGDEGFRELSQVDPEANEKIEKSIEEDKSEEWFQKKKKHKHEA